MLTIIQMWIPGSGMAGGHLGGRLLLSEQAWHCWQPFPVHVMQSLLNRKFWYIKLWLLEHGHSIHTASCQCEFSDVQSDWFMGEFSEVQYIHTFLRYEQYGKQICGTLVTPPYLTQKITPLLPSTHCISCNDYICIFLHYEFSDMQTSSEWKPAQNGYTNNFSST